MKTLVAVLLLVWATSAFAVDANEETDWGSAMFVQSITVNGEFGGSKQRDPPWGWNLNYSYDRSQTPNEGGPEIVDDTNNWSGGFDWTGDQGLMIGAVLNYSRTPAENLVARGGTVNVAFKWKYGDTGDKEDFRPSLTFKVNLGTTNYLESFNGSISRKVKKKIVTRPTSGTDEIRQNTMEPAVTWRPVEDWKFDAGIEADTYNRDVETFENNLDTPAALSTGQAGFSGTVGGLPRVTYNFGVAWEFLDDWRVAFTESWAILAADGTNSTTTKLTFDYQFAKAWKVTGGAEYLESETLVDTVGILGLTVEI